MPNTTSRVLLLTLSSLLAACQTQPLHPESDPDTTPATASHVPVAAISAEQRTSAEQQLLQTADSWHQLQLQQYPQKAMFLGLIDTQPLPVSDSHQADLLERSQQLQTELQQLTHDALSPSRALQARALTLRITQTLEWQACQQGWPELRPGNNTFSQGMAYLSDLPVNGIPDFHDLLKQMKPVAERLQEWQQRLQDQQNQKVVFSRAERDRVLDAVDQQLAGYPFIDSSEPSPLWNHLIQHLQSLTLYPGSLEYLQEEAASAITNQLVPTLRSLRTTLVELPVSDEISWQQQPSGDRCYRLQLTQAGAEESPELQLEFARNELEALQQQIREELQLEPAEALGPQVRAWLASHSQAPEQLKQRSLERLQTINQRLPQQFATLPDIGLQIDYAENGPSNRYPDHGYQPASPGESAARYRLVSTRADWRWPLDLYRGTLPGLHLQYGLAASNADLPDFMKYPLNRRLQPGWQSVAAELAAGLGGYQNASEHAWVLLDELEQQLNLVLDVGVHLYQWPQPQAIDYCLDNSFLSQSECSSRIDQIRNQPVYHAAEAISRARLLELIRQAEDISDDEEDLARFYSDLLRQGDLPVTLWSDWLRGRK